MERGTVANKERRVGDDESMREGGCDGKVQSRGSVSKQFVLTDVYIRQGGKKYVETPVMWHIILFTCFKLARFLFLHFHQDM